MSEFGEYLTKGFENDLKEIVGKEEWKEQYVNSDFYAWKYCYDAFQYAIKNPDNADIEYLCLQLSSYLAFWGMFRNSKLFKNKNHKILAGVVDVVLEEGKSLSDMPEKYDKQYFDRVLKIGDSIKHKYDVTLTDTLVTKILLGTLGCIPAYDTYVKRAFSEMSIAQTFNKKSIDGLISVYETHRKKIEQLEIYQWLKANGETDMKILDTCLMLYGKYLFKMESEGKVC